MRGCGGRSAQARSRRPWRKVEEGRKRGNRATAGVLGLFIGRRGVLGEGSSVWGRLIWSGATRRRAGGASRRRAAWRGGVAARQGLRGVCPLGGCQGAGQVVLESSHGSTWPRMRRGRGPPAAYDGRRAKQSSREGRDGGEGLSVISKSSGTSR